MTPRSATLRRAGGGLIGCGASLMALHEPWVALSALALVLLIFLVTVAVVVRPAVRDRCAARRRDARAVLRILVSALHNSR